MTSKFHKHLNYMALFIVLIFGLILFFGKTFMEIASSNIVLNGIIIGCGLFGIILCFYEMFALIPEYKWLRSYTGGSKIFTPNMLRPVAIALKNRPHNISADGLNLLLDMVQSKFNDSRESIQWITNTLVFLGLLGTFLGLIMTLGSFSDLLGGLDFQSTDVIDDMQFGLSRPLAGMATAFNSSLLGLGGSLVLSFLGLQIQLAQNTIFNELENYLANNTNVTDNPEKCIMVKDFISKDTDSK